MANIIIKRTVSLDGPVMPESMSAPLYQQENQAHQFEITCTRGGSAVTLTGSVQGRMIRADGQTVAITGSISGGKAVLTLPQSAYVDQGRFVLAIINVASGATTVIYSAMGNIARTTTGTVIDPGSVVPDLAELLAMIDEMEDATAAAEALVQNALVSSGTNITASNAQEICGNDLNNLPLNKVYGLAGGALDLAHAPANAGIVATLTQVYRSAAGAATTQILVTNNGVMYVRIYWSTSGWTEWMQSTITDDGLKKALLSSGTNITATNAEEICGSDLNNLPLNKIYALGGGSLSIAHAPVNAGLVATLSQVYRSAAGAATTQIFVTLAGDLYTRIYWGSGGWTEWHRATGDTLKILALGDSICRGGRNNSKGFVGDLGMPYINFGVGTATVSNVTSAYTDSVHKFSDADNIPNQLTSYYNATNAAILAAYGIDKFTPDVIIAQGGINDYLRGASMGTAPTQPVTTDSAANALDRSTLLGGLQYLFYQMVKLYPAAQRYFLISHKTYHVSGAYYAPVTTKGGGYTQQEMHDAIVACCAIYGVKVIDVYKDGMLDSIFSGYRSSAESWQSAASTDMIDHDGIHPLAYGYRHGYMPMVRQALLSGSAK